MMSGSALAPDAVLAQGIKILRGNQSPVTVTPNLEISVVVTTAFETCQIQNSRNYGVELLCHTKGIPKI